MEEADFLIENTLEVAAKTLQDIERQESVLLASQQGLRQTSNEFQASYVHLSTKSSWAAWIWSSLNESSLFAGGNERNKHELLSVNDHDDEEGTERKNAAEGEEVEIDLLSKLDNVCLMGERMYSKLRRSNDRITELSSSVALVEENMDLLHSLVVNDMNTLARSLENQGLFRLKVKPGMTHDNSDCYLGCRLRGKTLDCVQLSGTSSLDDRLEIFALYRCGNSPLGGLMHVSTGKWLGLDLFGRPVIQASKWAGWEVLVLTGGGIFFPSRNFGTGAWLCWALNAKSFDAFEVGVSGDRVEIELESIALSFTPKQHLSPSATSTCT